MRKSLSCHNIDVDYAVKFSARTLKGQLIGARIQAETLLNQAQQELEVAPLVGLSTHQSEQSKGNWLVGSKVKIDQGQQVMVESILDVQNIISSNSKLKLISAKLRKTTTIEGVYEQSIQHLESWNHTQVESKRIPGSVMAVVAISLAAVTGGMGASVAGFFNVTGMSATAISSTISSLCSMVGTSVVANGGDIGKTLDDLVSRDGVMALAANAVACGTLQGLGVKVPTIGSSIEKIAVYSALKTGVASTANVAFGRESLSESFAQAGINFITDVVGILGANKIGSLYNNGEGIIDFTTHKLAHGGLGLVLGSLKGDALAGALGGFVSELVADVTKDDVQKITEKVLAIADAEGIAYDSEDFKMIVREQIQATMNWGKVAAVVTAALAKRDVNIALDVATNAVENNLSQSVATAVMIAAEFSAFYGLTSLTASVIEDIYHTYQQDGADAAMTKLVHQGVAIAALDGGFRIAGAYFPTAKLAWAAYVEASPKLANMIKSGDKLLKRGKVSPSLVESSGSSRLTDSKYPINRELLQNQLASQQQLGEIGTIIAGGATKKEFRNASNAALQYGGVANDWVKKSSSQAFTKEGKVFEIHWIENLKTGQREEFKTVFPSGIKK